MKLRYLAIALGMAILSPWALAQTPLKIITTDQPGGGMDALIRPVAEKLAVVLGRPVVVENKVGAQGRIGGQAVVNSAPDGNTVLITVQAGVVINPHVYSWPYSSLTDLIPVTDLGRGSLILLAPSSIPANNFKELEAWLKKQPNGKINYGTYSPGTLSHFGGLLLAQGIGIEMTPIHYKASGDLMKDLVPGLVDIGWSSPAGPIAQLVKSGRLKAFAYMGPKRLPIFADIPTIRELGYPSVEADGWIGIFAPKGTPPDVVNKLQQSFSKVLTAPELQAMYLNFGFEPGGTAASDFAKLVQSDWHRYSDYVKKINYKVE